MYKQNIWKFTSYLPEKVTKFLNSIHDIYPKMPEFYIRPMFDRKIFFRDFFVKGGGQGNAPLPSPTPMAGPQAPHQLNPALLLPPPEGIAIRRVCWYVRSLTYFGHTISKRLEIEGRFQWNTNRIRYVTFRRRRFGATVWGPPSRRWPFRRWDFSALGHFGTGVSAPDV